MSRLTVDAAADAHSVLWLGHGAGGGIEALDLAALAATLPARGITVVRYEQPWRLAGKKVAPRPAALDAAWLEVAPIVRTIHAGIPLITGGRSAGARVACRTAEAVSAAAVICLAFPLHPPAHPERSRADELLMPRVPVLVLQGERDAFGSADLVASAIADTESITTVSIPGADHSMAVLKSSPYTPESTANLITASVAAFIERL
ncbi:hydrolase [Salinibacterium hongtaonis]|uniref:Hydrolase n=2 Tax=Homoserinimonas hongtaonis TaxID=2079791 RepID=A0A2U1T3J7_9MICO|nr:hydrolase [Salinibacterium hongtaonis]PWB98438.1 hydrolase [Salinibacterium hongtaonis]